jgi:hypothetical protein
MNFGKRAKERKRKKLSVYEYECMYSRYLVNMYVEVEHRVSAVKSKRGVKVVSRLKSRWCHGCDKVKVVSRWCVKVSSRWCQGQGSKVKGVGARCASFSFRSE